MDIQQLDKYHKSLDEFSRGNSQPIKMLYSHGDDAFLANPFGFTAIGWSQVSDALDFASSKFKDGEVKNFQLIAKYLGAELAIIFEIEKWKAKVGGREEVSSFDNIPSEFQKLTIPAAKYQKFTTATGKMTEVLITAWQKIWEMAPEDFGGTRTYQADFEIYDQRARDPANTILDIYIGIK